jgi:hypothetical protein
VRAGSDRATQLGRLASPDSRCPARHADRAAECTADLCPGVRSFSLGRRSSLQPTTMASRFVSGSVAPSSSPWRTGGGPPTLRVGGSGPPAHRHVTPAPRLPPGMAVPAASTETTPGTLLGVGPARHPPTPSISFRASAEAKVRWPPAAPPAPEAVTARPLFVVDRAASEAEQLQTYLAEQVLTSRAGRGGEPAPSRGMSCRCRRHESPRD